MEFEASLGYRVSSRTDRATQRKCLEKPKIKEKKEGRQTDRQTGLHDKGSFYTSGRKEEMCLI